jgi:hypothetical protein
MRFWGRTSRASSRRDIDRGRPAELLRLAAARARGRRGWRVRKDGSRFWADVILTAVRDETGGRDRLRQGDARLYRPQARRRGGDAAVEHALLANMDVRKLLEAISASLREVIPHDFAGWRSMTRRRAIWWRSFWARMSKGTLPRRGAGPLEGSVSGKVFRTREPVLLENIGRTRPRRRRPRAS